MFNTFAFLKYKELTKPDFSIIFLNSLAHLQHHYWNNNETNKQMKMCLRVLDNIIGSLLKSNESNESVVIINGLSQRKKDITHFMKVVNVRELIVSGM